MIYVSCRLSEIGTFFLLLLLLKHRQASKRKHTAKQTHTHTHTHPAPTLFLLLVLVVRGGRVGDQPQQIKHTHTHTPPTAKKTTLTVPAGEPIMRREKSLECSQWLCVPVGGPWPPICGQM